MSLVCNKQVWLIEINYHLAPSNDNNKRVLLIKCFYIAYL